ncbi:prepilin-type N-terminal cleavage/methylation domain-containing protein [candidate division WWE3 bacterium]|nr:prepilin-type N-terminal cleavage/methylation domain-containing protein [candidate division WWE3 bacterium]
MKYKLRLKNDKHKPNLINQEGFTLIELLVVVSLIIIVVGVTGDIIISLVRSYSKTQITNEVEQNANFAMNKMEKELRNASQLLAVSTESISFSQKTSTGALETVEYTVEDSTILSDGTAGVYFLARSVDGGAKVPVSNYSYPSGVTIVKGITEFSDVSPAGGPSVVKIVLSMRQVGNPTVQFTQSTILDSTIVLRGSY